VEGVNLLVLVCRKEDVVDIQDESLKSFVVVFFWGPGFGVDPGVLVAKFVVSLCCKVRIPIEVKHLGLLWLSNLYSISRQGMVWSNQGDWVGQQKTMTSSSRLAVFHLAQLNLKTKIFPSEFSSIDSKNHIHNYQHFQYIP
jgi:hypothetical protein